MYDDDDYDMDRYYKDDDYARGVDDAMGDLEDIKMKEDEFYQMIEDIRNYLRNNNKEYIELKKQIHKLMDRNLNIQKLYDENILENGLSSEECRDLSKILVLYDNLEDIVEKEIYFKGGMDAYYYFKKIDVIN